RLLFDPRRADQTTRIGTDDRRGSGGLRRRAVRQARAAAVADLAGLVTGQNLRRLCTPVGKVCKRGIQSPASDKTFRYRAELENTPLDFGQIRLMESGL